MMTMYCDESDDGDTYALAGWLAVPHGWDLFDPAWRDMLQSIRMPDGSPCPAFHASEIVGRNEIPDSRFKGWSFDDETRAFIRATDLIVDTTKCAILWPVGVAVEVPDSFRGIPRDSIWLMLFVKLFMALRKTFPAQRSISFVFDGKPSIAKDALKYYDVSKAIFDHYVPDYLSTITFADDAEHPALQAADLLVYEWRTRISDSRHRPGKAIRRSWSRIREVRGDGALWRYGHERFEEALKADHQGLAYLRAFLNEEPSHFD